MFRSRRLPVVPESFPVLSRGKHRNPRRGACFMELASVLAGESWSDHPRCTHPLLAELARMVNDCTSDDHRSELAPLVPSVIGLNPEGPGVDARIVLRCAQAALPTAPAERQHTLAIAILRASRVLAGVDGAPLDQLDEPSRRALDAVPEAARCAAVSIRQTDSHPAGLPKHTATAFIRSSVAAIAESHPADPDRRLRALLTDVISEVAAIRARAEAVLRDADTGPSAKPTDCAPGGSDQFAKVRGRS